MPSFARRLALLLTFMSFVSALTPTSAQAQMTHLAIGTYTKDPQGGIVVADFDTQTGAIGPATVAVPTANPSFLAWHPSGKFLYVVNEWGGPTGGGASAFRVEPQTQTLTPLNAVAIGGGPCHLAVDATGKFLLVATYNGGNISVWKLEADGRIGERVAFQQHTGHSVHSRQQAPHAHQVVLSPDNRFALVVDLGLDQIVVYRFNERTGELSDYDSHARFLALAPGAGPRHLAFGPDSGLDGSMLYAISELDNTVTAFRFNWAASWHGQGEGEAIQTLSTLPTGTEKSATAEIAVHPNGQFLYGSNRGHDSIVTYAIDGATGQLKLLGDTPTEGRNPRHFALDASGRWLLVANQSDRSLVAFRVDPNTGALTKTSVLTDVPGEPTCVTFFPTP